MKKLTLLFASVLLLASCGKSTFTIKGAFSPELQVPDSTVIGIDIKAGDSTATYKGIVKNDIFKISFPLPEEQLVVLDLGELGATMIAVEGGKTGNGEVNIQVGLNSEGQPVISKNGTVNNDFIQMYDDYEAEIYDAFNIEDEQLRDKTLESIINKVYRTLKGEENALTDINTLAGNYGFLNYYSVLELEQIDTLCTLMNEKSLSDKYMKAVYKAVYLQKESGKGKQYKDISASTPDGKVLSLSQLIGKTDYVLVDFWASWCGPCRRAMPQIKSLYDKYNGKLQILGVSLDNDEKAWKDAIKSMNLNWCHISDLQGWQAKGAQDYGVNSIPCTVLIDKEGVIIGRNLPLDDIEALLSE